jgi:hypothetical protein
MIGQPGSVLVLGRRHSLRAQGAYPAPAASAVSAGDAPSGGVAAFFVPLARAACSGISSLPGCYPWWWRGARVRRARRFAARWPSPGRPGPGRCAGGRPAASRRSLGRTRRSPGRHSPTRSGCRFRSATHSALGRWAVTCRSTRSAGRDAWGVGDGGARELAADRAGKTELAISRSTGQRATWMPSRCSCRQSLRAHRPGSWRPRPAGSRP